MADDDAKSPTSSLVSLYYSAPHILTEILYQCTPTSFDALRYTCKAIYSLTLDADLLRHQLLRLIETRPVQVYKLGTWSAAARANRVFRWPSEMGLVRRLLLE